MRLQTLYRDQVEIHKSYGLIMNQGSEFMNKQFQMNFKTYNTFGETHAAPIERFNRTLKDRMWYKFTRDDKMEWVSRLPKLMDKYNKTKHSSTKMTPEEASKKENETALLDIQQAYADKMASKVRSKIELNPGDIVRLAKTKRTFEKGYTPRWTNELFIIKRVNYNVPITYNLIDMKGEEISGSFYNEELQKSELVKK